MQIYTKTNEGLAKRLHTAVWRFNKVFNLTGSGNMFLFARHQRAFSFAGRAVDTGGTMGAAPADCWITGLRTSDSYAAVQTRNDSADNSTEVVSAGNNRQLKGTYEIYWANTCRNEAGENCCFALYTDNTRFMFMEVVLAEQSDGGYNMAVSNDYLYKTPCPDTMYGDGDTVVLTNDTYQTRYDSEIHTFGKYRFVVVPVLSTALNAEGVQASRAPLIILFDPEDKNSIVWMRPSRQRAISFNTTVNGLQQPDNVCIKTTDAAFETPTKAWAHLFGEVAEMTYDPADIKGCSIVYKDFTYQHAAGVANQPTQIFDNGSGGLLFTDYTDTLCVYKMTGEKVYDTGITIRADSFTAALPDGKRVIMSSVWIIVVNAAWNTLLNNIQIAMPANRFNRIYALNSDEILIVSDNRRYMFNLNADAKSFNITTDGSTGTVTTGSNLLTQYFTFPRWNRDGSRFMIMSQTSLSGTSASQNFHVLYQKLVKRLNTKQISN